MPAELDIYWIVMLQQLSLSEFWNLISFNTEFLGKFK